MLQDKEGGCRYAADSPLMCLDCPRSQYPRRTINLSYLYCAAVEDLSLFKQVSFLNLICSLSRSFHQHSMH